MTNKESSLDLQVKKANRQFYDAIADVYEQVDGRRNDELIAWLGNRMKELRKMADGDILLDIGCGSGVVMRCSKKYFKHVIGMDISFEILKHVKKGLGNAVCGEAGSLPFKNDTINAVVCFSVLHHIYDHKAVFAEIYRVLKKGGMLYIDHDLDRSFVKRFFPLIKLYRYFFDAGRRYSKESEEITKELYSLTEIHANGIDSTYILDQQREMGFITIKYYYHWFGLNGVLNKLMKYRRFKRGFAPLLSVFARKQ